MCNHQQPVATSPLLKKIIQMLLSTCNATSDDKVGIMTTLGYCGIDVHQYFTTLDKLPKRVFVRLEIRG